MTHDQQRVFVQNALEQLPLIKVRRFMTESLPGLSIFKATRFLIPGTNVTVSFEFQDNNVHFCYFYFKNATVPLRIGNHEWNVLPYTAITVGEMARKIDFFIKVAKTPYKSLSLDQFEQLLSEEQSLKDPGKYEISRDLGRQRFPGEEKKLFEIPTFCPTPTDSGNVPIFGYVFPRHESDFLKNVRLAPVVKTVSHKDFFLDFMIDYPDDTKVSLPLSYCSTLTREEFGQRFELCSKKTPHFKAMNSVLHVIECVEELLGKIPQKFLEPVVDAYIQSNYPSLYKKISDGKTILYSQNKRGEPPKVSFAVSDVDNSKKKIILDRFVGECLLKKEWPSMTQREATKMFHLSGPETPKHENFER